MKRLPLLTLLFISVSPGFMGFAQANPIVRPLGGPDATEQSLSSQDVTLRHTIGHVITSSHTLKEDRGDVAVITTTDHVIYLRGTISSDEGKEKVLSAVTPQAQGYRVENQLMTVSQ